MKIIVDTFRSLQGRLAMNAVVAAILNRKPKKEEGWRPDMSKWVNAKSLEAAPERVVLSAAEIKQIMDDHADRLRNKTFDKLLVDGQAVVEIKSENDGRYYKEADMSLEFGAQVIANNMSTEAALVRSPGFGFQNTPRGVNRSITHIDDPEFVPRLVTGRLDPKHERDTQAIGMGNIRKTGTMTDPQFHPTRSFNSPMEYENREMRRQREREEKRNKKRGKK